MGRGLVSQGCTGSAVSSSYAKLFESTCLLLFVCLSVLETKSQPHNSQTDNFSKILNYTNKARADEEKQDLLTIKPAQSLEE